MALTIHLQYSFADVKYPEEQGSIIVAEMCCVQISPSRDMNFWLVSLNLCFILGLSNTSRCQLPIYTRPTYILDNSY